MVSKASEDFPEPLNPVITVNVLRGISTSIFFKLCWRAPWTVMRSSIFEGDFHFTVRRWSGRTLWSRAVMATTPKLLTYEEWLKLPEVEGIEEVVNGEVRKMPPNKWNHTRVNERLASQLRSQL